MNYNLNQDRCAISTASALTACSCNLWYVVIERGPVDAFLERKNRPPTQLQNKFSRGRRASLIQNYNNYRKDSCISRTFLSKFWVKNRGCGLYTRPLI